MIPFVISHLGLSNLGVFVWLAFGMPWDIYQLAIFEHRAAFLCYRICARRTFRVTRKKEPSVANPSPKENKMVGAGCRLVEAQDQLVHKAQGTRSRM